MAAVACESLTHRYGERLALDAVSFSVDKGSLFGLVGPNGGGKSTTFRILATSLKPDAGTVTVLGEDALRHPYRVRGRLGVLFQSPALDKKLTVEENLRHHGHLYGLSGAPLKTAVDRWLLRMGLGDRRRDRAETLSGGLKRRLELAKGMLHGPELLILDEPTTGLDPLARKSLWDHLKSLVREEGLTVLVTTHLLDEADACDALAFLDGGKLVAAGEPGRLRASVGREVIAIRTKAPEDLRRALRDRYRLEANVVDGEVRLARDEASALVGEWLQAFGFLIESLTVGKPTLEDFFIARTGHRYTGEVSP